ncbi:MAG: hypothetical protein R8L53_02725, partial [Mariprofundales bacterium]
KLITTTTPKNGNNDERFGFVLQAGMLSSALEHTVPEQMFSTATQKAEAVSTVKLLNIAAQQGMPILHITPANKSTTIPALQLAPEVIAEIQAAIAVGKEVITHQSNITAFGWTGAGYAIFDPVTGDGAWRISGGGNGAAFALGTTAMALIIIIAIAMIAVNASGGLAVISAFGSSAAAVPAIITMLVSIIAIISIVALLATMGGASTWNCFFGGMFATIAIAGVTFGGQIPLLISSIALLPSFITFTNPLDQCI